MITAAMAQPTAIQKPPNRIHNRFNNRATRSLLSAAAAL